MWEGSRHPCGYASAGRAYYKMWAALNGFNPRNDLVQIGVRIGMGCMNLVTVISTRVYGTWVSVNLMHLLQSYIRMRGEAIVDLENKENLMSHRL